VQVSALTCSRLFYLARHAVRRHCRERRKPPTPRKELERGKRSSWVLYFILYFIMVDAPSLESFKVRLDGALSNLIELKMSLLTAGGWVRWPLKVPSNPNHFTIL